MKGSWGASLFELFGTAGTLNHEGTAQERQSRKCEAGIDLGSDMWMV